MSLAVTPPHTLCVWQQWQRQEQPAIFTGLQWLQGLVVPFASQDSTAGCPLMFLVFLVRWEENTGVSPWWKQGFLGDSDTSMARAGSHRLHRDTVMSSSASRPRCNACPDLWRYSQGQQFRLMMTVQRRRVYHLTVAGAYSGTLAIFTGCFEADRVTLFRNSTARGTLRGLTSDALL